MKETLGLKLQFIIPSVSFLFDDSVLLGYGICRDQWLWISCYVTFAKAFLSITTILAQILSNIPKARGNLNSKKLFVNDTF